MKILQIISGKSVNGALVHCKLLAHELADAGHDVTVLCRRKSWIWDELDRDRLRVTASEMERWPFSKLRESAKWVRDENFDVMHTHMSRAHTFGILMKHLSGTPVVATAHNRHFQLHWRMNDRVIANSEATRSYHRRYNRVSPEKLETIHCFIDSSRFLNVAHEMRQRIRERWGIAEDAPVIGIVGDVTKRKGHWYLFQALPQLLKRFPDLRIVLVGRFDRRAPYVQKLRRFQLQNNLERRVIWWGRRKHIQNVMSGLDVLVAPSLEEPMGMVPLEAMAAGTAVVASRTGGLVEVVQDRENGLLVPCRDPGAIAEAVGRLLGDRQLRDQFVTAGQRWVRDRFSPQSLSEQVAQTLLQTSQMKSRAA